MKTLRMIVLFGLLVTAACSEVGAQRTLEPKVGTVVDGFQFEGGPVRYRGSWKITDEKAVFLKNKTKQVGYKFENPVSGQLWIATGDGWIVRKDGSRLATQSQRTAISMAYGPTLASAVELERLESTSGNPLTRNLLKDRQDYIRHTKTFESGLRAIHEAIGLNQERSDQLWKQTIPSTFDAESDLIAKAELRRTYLNQAAAAIGKERPFATQEFLEKVQAKSSDTKAP